MSKSIVSQHYQRILTQWPIDLLRPNVSFQKALQHRIDTRLTPSTSTSKTAPQDNVVANQAQATVPTPVPFDEKGELEQANALYSFLENRYTKRTFTPGYFAKQYPLSPKMLKPASNPDYYHNLLKELDEAPKRSWFEAMWLRVKGSLRFS